MVEEERDPYHALQHHMNQILGFAPDLEELLMVEEGGLV